MLTCSLVQMVIRHSAKRHAPKRPLFASANFVLPHSQQQLPSWNSTCMHWIPRQSKLVVRSISSLYRYVLSHKDQANHSIAHFSVAVQISELQQPLWYPTRLISELRAKHWALVRRQSHRHRILCSFQSFDLSSLRVRVMWHLLADFHLPLSYSN